MTVSALSGDGIEAAWDAVAALDAARAAMGWRAARRRAQAVRWFHFELEQGLLAALRADPETARTLPAMERQVAEGALPADAAAEEVLDQFLTRGVRSRRAVSS